MSVDDLDGEGDMTGENGIPDLLSDSEQIELGGLELMLLRRGGGGSVPVWIGGGCGFNVLCKGSGRLYIGVVEQVVEDELAEGEGRDEILCCRC